MTMTEKQRKRITGAAAVVVAAAILITGTFAWTSISQVAKNETIVDINPGGRLHDDFNGYNKDVYVENFGDELTGVPIYARIRLDQYMEIGQEAGEKDITENRKAYSISNDDTAVLTNTATWTTYIPDVYNVKNENSVFFQYWDWTLGNDSINSRYYMPTFDKNKDSLQADINGTYDGTNPDDPIYYDDYVKYSKDSILTRDAVYDHDSDTIEDYEKETDDASKPIDAADVYITKETHAAKRISSTAEVITMAEWIERGKEAGPYWVYDRDGWAYWAQAILPGETTGMLLDDIEMKKKPDDNWYYGINVVGQFVTLSDMSAFTSNGETITDNALELLGVASQTETAVEITGSNGVMVGGTSTYTAAATYAGVAANMQPTFTWTAADAKGNPIEGVSIKDGTLTVTDTVELGTKIYLTATEVPLTSDDEPRTANKTVTVVASGVNWNIKPIDASDDELNSFDDAVTFCADGIKEAIWSIESTELILIESEQTGKQVVTVTFSDEVKNGTATPSRQTYTLTATDKENIANQKTYKIKYVPLP